MRSTWRSTVVQEQDWLASRDLSHLLTFPPGAATTELVLAASRFSSEPDATGTLTASAGGTAIAGGSKTVTIVSTAAAAITVRYDMPEYTFEENAAIDDLAIYAVATLHEDYPRAPSEAFLVSFSSRASTATCEHRLQPTSPNQFGLSGGRLSARRHGLRRAWACAAA